MEPGLTFQANFATNLFVRMAGTYNGLFAHTNGEVNQQSAGMLRNLSVKKDGTYSGQLLVSGVAYTLSGKFDRSARSSKIISRSVTAGGPVNVDLHLIWDNTPRQLLGTVSTPSWTAELIANLSGTQMQTGIATVLIPPAEDTLQPSPAGYGYILTTTKAGTVTFTGALADRTPISQTVAISEQGWSPIYASLYKNTGLLWGWMAMTNNSPSGTLYWIKPASTALLFPNGFTNSIETISSPWRIPTGPALPFSPTNFGILEISGGPLTAPITFSNIIVRADNTLINVSSSPTNTLSGSIAPKTGLLKITFGNGKTKTAAAGAVLQNSTNAAGAFLGTTNTGTFTLH